MNDWDATRKALYASPDMKEGRKGEIWRWTELARGWLDTQAIDIARVDHPTMLRFVAEVEPTSGPKNRSQRLWALKALADIARSSTPPQDRRTDTLAARVQAVPSRCPLGKAIGRVLERARSDAERRRWETCLGAFLEWCDRREIVPEDAWEGDVESFGRDRRAEGFRSPGEYVRLARRLVRELTARRSAADVGSAPARHAASSG